MPRPELTVVIRTRSLLLRADLRGRSEPRIERWRDTDLDAASAVSLALREGGRPGKRVWILDSEVWLGLVGLASGAVAGLADKALAEPAAFEAEALSDLRPSEAVTAVQRRRIAEQDDQFLVAQARRVEVVAIAKAVRSAGAKLAGISHPAGLVEALSFSTTGSSERTDWRRVEFWSDSVVLVESIARRVRMIPLGVGPDSDWRRALDRSLRGSEASPAVEETLLEPGVRARGGPSWRDSIAASGTARWLAAGEEPPKTQSDEPIWDLRDDTTADAFAAAWARRLATAETSIEDTPPVLRPPKAPAARWPAVVVGVLALASAIAMVYWQRIQAEEQRVDLGIQVAGADARVQKVKRLRTSAQQAKLQVQAKRKIVADLQHQLDQAKRKRAVSRPVIVDRRPALAAMMSALSESASPDIMIQAIEHGSPQHTIAGTALSPEAAAHLVSELSSQLKGYWAVSPARIEPQPGQQHVVWRFSTVIIPLGSEGSQR